MRNCLYSAAFVMRGHGTSQYRLDICNGPISLAQTAITSALYGKIFRLKVKSLSYKTKTPTAFYNRESVLRNGFITLFPGSLNFFERGFPLRKHKASGFSVVVFQLQACTRNVELGFSVDLYRYWICDRFSIGILHFVLGLDGLQFDNAAVAALVCGFLPLFRNFFFPWNATFRKVLLTKGLAQIDPAEPAGKKVPQKKTPAEGGSFINTCKRASKLFGAFRSECVGSSCTNVRVRNRAC